jgi:D-glycero-alpha-D-manno-heptose 1-phosphate guanylyltransferase
MQQNNRVSTAIILAGGFGTRLRAAIQNLPKCMAPVQGVPFINYVIHHLEQQGIQHFIFSLGYLHEMLTAHLDHTFPLLQKTYSIEDTPMGTGGAIKQACSYTTEKDVLALNGDTLFEINLAVLYHQHLQTQAQCTIALKHMTNFDRYGTVTLQQQRVTAFHEKKYCTQGLINGGIYLLNRQQFLNRNSKQQFSMEKDYLEVQVKENSIYGLPYNDYFIDIGIPEDYLAFQQHIAIGKKI